MTSPHCSLCRFQFWSSKSKYSRGHTAFSLSAASVDDLRIRPFLSYLAFGRSHGLKRKLYMAEAWPLHRAATPQLSLADLHSPMTLGQEPSSLLWKSCEEALESQRHISPQFVTK